MFEEQRVKEKKERQALRNLTQQDKLRTMVVNFQLAQNLRSKEKEFLQAKFFQKELIRLVNKEDHGNRESSLKRELTALHSQIDGLEQKEMQMLESL